jgi:ketosteroid isomerase-like protein
MSDPKIDIITTIYEAFGRGDVATILDQVSDDVDWAAESFGSKAAPWHGIHKGQGEVPGFFQGLAEAIDVDEFDIRSMAANDDEVFVAIRFGFTGKATGRSGAMDLHHRWTLADGKVIRYRGSEDTALVVEVLGL